MDRTENRTAARSRRQCACSLICSGGAKEGEGRPGRPAGVMWRGDGGDDDGGNGKQAERRAMSQPLKESEV